MLVLQELLEHRTITRSHETSEPSATGPSSSEPGVAAGCRTPRALDFRSEGMGYLERARAFATEGSVFAGYQIDRVHRQVDHDEYEAHVVGADDEAVLIKTLRRSRDQGPEANARFAREIALLKALRHPNVAKLRETGEFEDVAFVVFESVHGRTLAEEIARGPLGVARSVRIAMQTAQALAQLHAQGVFHRDLKPENILLTEKNGEPDFVLVTDFGVGSLEAKAGHAGVVLGTPAYLPPELARGDQASARSDLYSLGIVLYEMLSGAPPFHSANNLDVLVQQIESPVPSLRDRAPKVPAKLESVVRRSLAKHPSDRFATAEAMASELSEVLQETRAPSVAPDAVAPAASDGPDPRLEDCVNQAFGVVVNDLRLQALRQRKKQVASDIPLERLENLTEAFASGHAGVEGAFSEQDIEDLEPETVAPILRDPEEVRRLISALAPRWGAKVTGDHVHLTVAAPRATKRSA